MTHAAHPGRVLIVEDEPFVNLAVSEALRDEGLEPICAYTAEQGLAILKAEPDVRVVFTDVNLPGRLDGIALVHEVQRRWPEVEVLITSAERPRAIDELAIVAWQGRFVAKPYPPSAVVRRIRDIVAARAATRPDGSYSQ